MKKNFLVLVACLSTISSFGQIFKENPNDVTKAEIGFLYFTDKEYPTFVPVKNQFKDINISDFNTKSLKSGVQISWKQLWLDTLTKYEYAVKLSNYSPGNTGEQVTLSIIPVRLHYRMLKYSKSDSQLNQDTNIDKLKFNNNYVVIKSYGGLPVEVDSVRVKK